MADMVHREPSLEKEKSVAVSRNLKKGKGISITDVIGGVCCG